MASSQDIEARLCAYIDGTLDAEQRAEIERHFQAYPQHRQMIQDLIRMRGLVSNLPRARTPADLGEGLQGQLERSMLLGDGDFSHEPRLRSGHVARWAAAAAVLVLSAGLGSVLYLMLRGAGTSSPLPVAVVSPPPLPPAPLVAPATQPTIVATSAPATQPVKVAAAPQPPATQPIIDDLNDEQANMDDISPNAQPNDAILAAETAQPAPAATQPVADEGDDK
jgi:anti-sigma factor RsiW